MVLEKNSEGSKKGIKFNLRIAVYTLKIEENRHEINTKRTTAWAIGVFKDWLVEKGMSADIENYNADTLRSFFCNGAEILWSKLFRCKLQ